MHANQHRLLTLTLSLGRRLNRKPAFLSRVRTPSLVLPVIEYGYIQHSCILRYLIHHHELVSGLVLEILSDLAGREIPHFDEAVH